MYPKWILCCFGFQLIPLSQYCALPLAFWPSVDSIRTILSVFRPQAIPWPSYCTRITILSVFRLSVDSLTEYCDTTFAFRPCVDSFCTILSVFRLSVDSLTKNIVRVSTILSVFWPSVDSLIEYCVDSFRVSTQRRFHSVRYCPWVPREIPCTRVSYVSWQYCPCFGSQLIPWRRILWDPVGILPLWDPSSQYCATLDCFALRQLRPRNIHSSFDHRSTPCCHRAPPTSWFSLADSFHARSTYPAQTFFLDVFYHIRTWYIHEILTILLIFVSLSIVQSRHRSVAVLSRPSDHSNLCLPSAVRHTSTPCAFRDSRYTRSV